jgi:hypothetical protein
MRALSLAAASTLALAAAACAPHVDYAARTRLDCPDSQGELSRVSVAADGKSCLYRAGDVDVALQLTPVSDGDPYATLKSVETSLVGSDGDKTQAAADQATQASAKVAQPSAAAHDAAAQAAREADADAGHSGWSIGGGKAIVSVEKGRKDVHAHDDDNDDDDDGDNGQAHVNLPGLHIDADNGAAKVDVAGVHIDASDDSQTVRITRDVRLRGEGFSPEKRGVRATFIAKREDMPGGFQFVGYEASGPKTGPLAVAIVRSHEDINNGNRLYHDIQRLVRRNGGA